MAKLTVINIYAFLVIIDTVISYPTQDFYGYDGDGYIDENGILQELEDYDDAEEYLYPEFPMRPKRKELRELIPRYEEEFTISRRPRNCACMCQRKYGRSACCACTWTKNVCFPAAATVTLDNGSTSTMAQLEEGQKVLTATDSGELVYSEVRIFMKRIRHTLSPYLMLRTSSAVISLSESHVIFVANGNGTSEPSNKFAGDVKVGDHVLVNTEGSLKPEPVTHIHKMNMEGVYVPLTEHGTIIVDGVLASCYASFDHRLAHVVLAPLRWWPSLFGAVRLEDDMPSYVYAVKEIGRFLTPSGYQDRPHWIKTLLPAS